MYTFNLAAVERIKDNSKNFAELMYQHILGAKNTVNKRDLNFTV